MLNQLLSKFMASALVLIMALALLAACSSGDEETTTTATTTQPVQQPAAPAPAEAPATVITSTGRPIEAAAAAPATGSIAQSAPVEAKVTRVIFGLIPPTLEHYAPAKNGPPTSQPLTPMYEYLVGMDPVTGQVIPQLATEWSVDSDGSSWRFKLREGVQFQKGWGEFTAADVKHTRQQIAATDATHGNSPFFRNFVDSVEIVNDHEVVFRAPNPTADMFFLISQQGQSLLIQSKAHRDSVGLPTLATEPTVGTGPYQFTKGVSGSFIRYERVPFDHWRISPDFKELELRWMPEASTRVAGMLAGEIHLSTIPQDNLKQMTDGGLKVVSGNVPGLRTFMALRCCIRLPADTSTRSTLPTYDAAFKYPDAPMQDLRVREAINRSIDRNLLNESFFGGKGEIMVNNNFHPTREGWDPSWAARFDNFYGYDPAKARDLLAEAGYGPNNPVEIKLQSINLAHYSGSLDVVEAVAGFMREVGIKPKLIVTDSATFRAEGRNFEHSNRLVITGTSSNLLLGIRVYATHSTPRTGNPEHPVMDDLFIKIRGSLDAVQQDIWLKQLGEISFTTYTVVPLFWLPPEAVINPEVVSDYIFPGAITSTWTHLEFIKAAQ